MKNTFTLCVLAMDELTKDCQVFQAINFRQLFIMCYLKISIYFQYLNTS